jgi:hypothetical protein
MRAVVAWLSPLPIEIKMKKTGKERERAARASVPSHPAQKVSTTLNMVWKNIPTLMGNAICHVSREIGSEVRER